MPDQGVRMQQYQAKLAMDNAYKLYGKGRSRSQFDADMARFFAGLAQVQGDSMSTNHYLNRVSHLK
jgi:hypothetical protein